MAKSSIVTQTPLIIRQTKYLAQVLTLATCWFLSGCGSTHSASQRQTDTLSEPVVLSAINDFAAPNSERPRLSYIDQQRQSLAIDAARFKTQFASAEHLFAGTSGIYSLRLTTLLETDGESQYSVRILRADGTSSEPDTVTNPESETDFVAYQHRLQDARIEKGDRIQVAFNAHTNGKIPEGNGTAYSRGRWTQLLLQCVSECR